MNNPLPSPTTNETPDPASAGKDSASATVVTVTDLSIRIPDGPVLLRPTSLTVRAGEITALTGASGSGKTTLLRTLIGHLPAQATTHCTAFDVLGHHVPSLDPTALRTMRRTQVAYVGQDPGSALNPRMKIRHLVAETAPAASEQAVLDLLRECKLPTDGGFPDRRPTAISGGQQRRVALARALARTPDLLLLDEPTAGLDKALRDDIASLLRHLATSRGLAIVMACHDPELVDACADHVVQLTTAQPRLPRQRTPLTQQKAESADSPVDGITAQSVSVTFRGRGTAQLALDKVDFVAASGSATAIIGPSGSGKTTLLRVLAGLQRPDAGSLVLDGHPLAHAARKRRREHHRRIQLVPQNPLGALNPSRTIGAALARPLRRHTELTKAQIAARITELLDQVDLPADFVHRYPHELSGGQRQRVSIARALTANPDFLLCDEITSALDPDTAIAIMELLQRLRTEHDMAITHVSHETHLVAAYTDTVHILETGRLTAHGPTTALMPT
ncbi:peptide ABC transporter ATP-binding protein [Streptomyces atratus]|uniref:ABC transporter ATP-binding protein n=1 Tax=Streptomyces atratus TaxID=1893 RepID=UPI0019C65FD1|nr:ATP-binding cassette domain-containing protein [Streptomyces atratus]GGT63082.1 peptide ABC transporter ATP-binding protein [Streptomyces atratus]